MQAMSYEKFQELARENELFLQENPELRGTKPASDAEIIVEQAEVLEKIKAVKGIEFAPADYEEKNIAASVTKQGIKTNIALWTLDLPFDQILQIVNHEKIHMEDLSKGVDINLHETKVPTHQQKALSRAVSLAVPGAGNIAEIKLIEGFTELRNADQHGENCNCAYNHLEVPAAKELESLAQKQLGKSFVTALNSGNMEAFYKMMRDLGDRLLLLEMTENMQVRGQEYLPEGMTLEALKSNTKKNILILKPFTSSAEDAERICKKVAAEILEMAQIKEFLAMGRTPQALTSHNIADNNVSVRLVEGIAA